MKIDGRQIARSILDDLRKEVEDLRSKNIVPELAVILVGDDPASEAYVRQKQIRGEEIGIKVTLIRRSPSTTQEELLRTIGILNSDKTIHGIVLQQPLPPNIDVEVLTKNIDAKKDVDGFCQRSLFTPPIAEAVITVLKNISSLEKQNFQDWIINKKTVVIGKGKTGGKPIINRLQAMQIPLEIIDTKTPNPEKLTQSADIIISCVGKKNTLKSEDIKDGAVLLAVGMQQGDDGKLFGDYSEEEIKNKASYYTPVPGGIGPVNVAKLLQNVVDSAKTIDNV